MYVNVICVYAHIYTCTNPMCICVSLTTQPRYGAGTAGKRPTMDLSEVGELQIVSNWPSEF